MRGRNELPFHLVDVFTDERFGGNPLAVVPDSEDLDEATMRRIARELNLSETTFLSLPPDGTEADWRLRSFTAAGVEVFGAGHNALGAWWWLADSGRLQLGDQRSIFQQLIGNRVLPVEIVSRDHRPVSIGMIQAQPAFGTILDDPTTVASSLGLLQEELEPRQAPQVVSTGAAHLLVPVRDRSALEKCRPNFERLTDVLRSVGGQGCYVFTMPAALSGPTVFARFFNPSVGIAEDPATGSAAGPLACFLRARGALREQSLIVNQGIEMHRPSRIEVVLDHDRVRVFGRAVLAGEGRFYLIA